MNRCLGVFSAAFAALALCACNSAPSAFSYYNACARESTSFVNVAACGKKARNENCEQMHSC